jgi:MtrB/PioB family decaheme-associated outer membrane protein
MRTSSPLTLLGALGLLAVSATAGAVDTSQWKCESCPFEDTVKTATVDVGAIGVSDDATTHGDYTGITKQGAYLGLGGSARYRSESGNYASLDATNLGLDSRAASAQIGKEGTYRLQLGYSQIPRHFFDGARTPFQGLGGSVLSLPAGFPAVTTAAMPLDSTLRDIDVGYKRSRLEAGLLWIFGPEWTTRVGVRHDERNGMQRLAGSFFSTSSQLPAPVDQSTDQFEASASRFGKHLQFTLAYQGSLFRNNVDGLTWTNPFLAVVPGATQGQLAMAPDNQFHQIAAMAGYQLTPKIQASANVAAGRLTQNASYLAATLNPNLSVALPATSLDGLVYTFNADVRLTAAVTDRLRLSGSYARDVRDNRTVSRAYPAVSTDMFTEPETRTNQPFSFINDRYRFSVEYRAPGNVHASVGVTGDNRERTRQEVENTRETTVWGGLAMQALDGVSLSAKYSHAERDPSTYGIAAWVDPAENTLLRKYYLAKRSRDKAGVRADVAIGEKLSIGFGADVADDQYKESTLGLLDGRSVSADADVAVTVTENLQAHAFIQGERTRSHQAGSQLYAQPDWWARIEDSVTVAGAGVKHSMLKNKLELAADFTRTRSHTDTWLDVITVTPQFPQAVTKLDTVKVQATYSLKKNFALIGSYWYERYSATDWHYEDVAPDTVQNLLLFGNTLPRYYISVYALTLRCRF